MALIAQFVEAYEREYDFWRAVARRAHSLIEGELGSSGLRAIVTSRAKSLDRLRDKLEQRNRIKAYRKIGEIYDDVVDLAGVRVALYFPSQSDEVAGIINNLFEVVNSKTFPDPTTTRPGEPRFAGYRAHHFRVRIRPNQLAEDEQRYGSAAVEIQVASVLMHGWSEVEHDLVYKPLEGNLSSAEYALLDQLNGLVWAGEIALEQLKLAGDQRLANVDSAFRDHYEMAEFLRSQPQMRNRLITDAALGSVDLLFNLLVQRGHATAQELGPLALRVNNDFEERPIADQIIDILLLENPDLYKDLSRAIAMTAPSQRRHEWSGSMRNSSDVEMFINLWTEVEGILTNMLGSDVRPTSRNLFRAAADRGLIDSESAMRLEDIRQMRNAIVHGAHIRSGRTKVESLLALPQAIGDLLRILEGLRSAGQE